MNKGQELKLQWPSTPNVLSIKTTDLIQSQLIRDPLVTVSEKLDGSNVCLSSQGWIASRRVIIVEDLFDEDLSKVKLNNSPLSKLNSFKTKIVDIHDKLKTTLKRSDFQTLVYGEWLQNRTATTQQDRFDYKKRGFETSQFYAFGLAVHFNGELSKSENDQMRTVLQTEQGWIFAANEELPQLHTATLNQRLQAFFKDHNVSTAPVLAECSLGFALTNRAFIEDLVKQKVEGFILTSDNLMLKWKFVDKVDKTYHIEALNVLKSKAQGSSVINVIEALEEVCLNSKSEIKHQPKKKPDKQLYSKLFKSAETKFPKIENVFENLVTKEERATVQERYRADFKREMKNDLVELGYDLENEYDEGINKFVDSIFQRRSDNWSIRLQTKKTK